MPTILNLIAFLEQSIAEAVGDGLFDTREVKEMDCKHPCYCLGKAFQDMKRCPPLFAMTVVKLANKLVLVYI
jgi:hypothetical protein